MVDIEELVSKARAYLGNRKDDKKWCSISDMIALLEAGATPININEGQIGEGYFHEISYEGIIFINATETPVQELERYKIE
jgi:hypothetical protein